MNAVFERDFVAYSASARFQWMRFGIAAAMGVTMLVLVVPAYVLGDFSNIGSRVFTASVWIGMALMLVTVPGSFATVLVHARAGSTLPVLLTTPLSPVSIAAGAFSARAAAFLALLVATWPPIASSLLFGGVRGSQLFAATATLAATGFIVATPAFVASAFARRTTVAVVSAYLAAVAAVAALHLAGGRLALAGTGWSAAALSPLHAAGEATGTGGSGPVHAPYVLLAWSLALAAAAVGVAAWRLAREGRGTADSARIAALGGRQCRPMRHASPVLDRETRAGLLRGSGRGLFVLLLVCEAVYLLLANARHEATYLPLHFGVLSMQCFLIVLAVTAAGATSLAAEREGRTLDLVRVSPLTPREIVVGKILGLFRGFAPCLAVPLGHLALGAALGVFSPAAVVLTALTGAVAMSAWAVFGLSQSLDQTDPNRAVRRTMAAFGIVAVLVAANVGLPVNGVFRNVDEWVRMAVAFGANPVALTLLPAAALRTGGSDAANSMAPAPDGGDLAFALVGGVLWIALYAVFGFAVYRRLFRMYRTRVDG